MKSLIVMSLLLLSACSQNDETNPPPKAVADSVAKASALPKATGDFPDYAPQYPGSEILETSKTSDDDFSSTQFTMTTNDPIAKVSEFYRTSLSKAATMPITYDESTPEKLDIMAGDFVGGVEGKTKTNLGTSLSAKILDGKTHIYVMFNRPLA